MKTLMLTSAIMLATTGIVAAQTAPAGDAAATAPAAANVPAFRASDFIGKDLYTLDAEIVTELRGTETYDEGTARWSSGETFIAGRDRWEDVGDIDDLVMTQDGELRGVLLDVGGFLGIGARNVMVEIDDLYFVADTTTPEDLDDFFVVATLSREQLEALPEWNDENLSLGYPVTADAAAPAAAMDGDAAVGNAAATPPSAEELTGATVLDATGESIGEVGDLVLDGDRVTGARIDVGGFLGMGTHDVIVPIENLGVLRDADGNVERVETSLTREQLEALPAQE